MNALAAIFTLIIGQIAISCFPPHALDEMIDNDLSCLGKANQLSGGIRLGKMKLQIQTHDNWNARLRLTVCMSGRYVPY